jgi:predicted RNA-binding protein with PIN domain
MSDDHLIIVDGYNLIHRSPLLRPGSDRTLEESREKLVNLLTWAVGTGESRFLVVFDGAGSGGTVAGSGRVEVRYSRAGQTADDVIKAIVEDQVERRDRVTVVTADLDIARHARAMGANVSISDLFMGSVLGPAAPGAPDEKPGTLSRAELEKWREIFERRGPTPDREDETGH